MDRRSLSACLLAAVRKTPVAFLQGPRQSGKSTLVQARGDEDEDAAYLTLDEAPTLAAAQTDPDGFIGGLPERVILDEVQRVPELFRAIKRGVDIDHRPGRLLLTGSAQALVLPRLLGVAGRENESFDALALQPGRNRRTPRRFYRRVLRG